MKNVRIILKLAGSVWDFSRVLLTILTALCIRQPFTSELKVYPFQQRLPISPNSLSSGNLPANSTSINSTFRSLCEDRKYMSLCIWLTSLASCAPSSFMFLQLWRFSSFMMLNTIPHFLFASFSQAFVHPSHRYLGCSSFFVVVIRDTRTILDGQA